MHVSGYRVFFCILLFQALRVHGEKPEPAFRHFTTEDGLPSSQIYQALQDVDGFMWFATDRGVVKYNGYEFKTFTTKDGLTDNVVLNLFQDFKKRIWMISISGSIFIYENNTIKPFQYNAISKKIFKGSYQFEISVDSSETVCIESGFGVCSISLNGEVKHIVNRLVDQNVIRLTIDERSQLKKPVGLGYISRQNRVCELFHLQDASNVLITLGRQENGRIRAVRRHNKTLVVGIAKTLYELKGKTLTPLAKFDHDIIELIEDDSENLWVCTSKGLLVYRFPGNYRESNKYLDGIYISSITKDHENGYWITTIDYGVFNLVNHDVGSYYNEPAINSPLILTKDRSSMYAGYFNGSIAKMNTRELKPIIIESMTNGVISIFFDTSSARMLVCNDKLEYWKNNKFFPIENPKKLKANTGFVQNKNGLFAGAYGSVLRIIRDEPSYAGPFNIRINCIFSTETDQLILGCIDGVYKLDENFKSIQLLDSRFKDIRVDDINSIHGNLCFATHGKGILILRNNGNILTINESNGLCSNIIHTMSVSGNTLWCGSNNGLSKVEFSTSGDDSYQITPVNVNNGLISNEIIDIDILRDTVWIASKKGISFFYSKVDFVNHSIPKVYFTSLKVNNADTILQNNYQFSHLNNSISIGFESPVFKSNGKQTYKYLLTNQNDSIKGSTINREVEFLSLKPGHYSFQVKAMNNSGVVSLRPTIFQFVILSPCWQRTWFRILGLFALLLSGYLFYKRRVSLIEKKYFIEKKQASLQLTAMRAQMNPHFIFNVMDSIRSYMMDKDVNSAEKYLTSFAKLVRYTLEHSDKQECSLSDELSMIRIYSDLEKLRFSDPIDVEFDYDKSIQTDEIMIPAMMLQPFVENAFKHGMKNKVSRPKLIIRLIEINRNVQVIIENHGIDKPDSTQSNSKQKKERNSYGLALVQERIAAYNNAYSRKIQYKSDELVNESGVRTGMRVVVRL